VSPEGYSFVNGTTVKGLGTKVGLTPPPEVCICHKPKMPPIVEAQNSLAKKGLLVPKLHREPRGQCLCIQKRVLKNLIRSQSSL